MGKKINWHLIEAVAVICAGMIFVIYMGFATPAPTPIYHVDSNPATPNTFDDPTANATVPGSRVIAINASYITPTGLRNAGITNNSVKYMNGSGGSVFPFNRVICSNATLQGLLGHPLTCANGSSVVFKLESYYNNVAGIVTHDGTGAVFCADGTWWMTTRTISSSPAFCAAQWSTLVSNIIAIAD